MEAGISKEKIDLKLGKFGQSKATEPSKELLDKIMVDTGTSSFERLSKQEPSCWFGEWGVCCRMCYMGPCRITSARFNHGASRGVCGATADTIVARNLLRETVGGASSHSEHAFEIAETLKAVASEGIKGYEIKDRDKLISVANRLKIETQNRNDKDIALDIANTTISDFSKTDGKPMRWVEGYAPSSSLKKWEKLGIVPSNSMNPIVNAMHRTSMGNDADVVNLMLADLKMGIIDGYSGLTMSTELSDILFGTPEPVSSVANIGVIKEDYVNLAIHGHNPLVAEKVVEWAQKLNDDALKIGAKGINLVGVCCSGNEVLMRHGIPMAANEMQAELAIATGALDAMVADFQCIWPVLGEVASCYHTKLITTMPYVNKKYIQYRFSITTSFFTAFLEYTGLRYIASSKLSEFIILSTNALYGTNEPPNPMTLRALATISSCSILHNGDIYLFLSSESRGINLIG